MIKQISIFVENKPGSLISVCTYLAENNIDMRAFSIADTQDYGILRIIVSDTEKALNVLKEKNILATVTDIVGVLVPDKPGGMLEILNVLAKENISIEYAYAFVSSDENSAYLAMRVENPEQAEKILLEKGIREISPDEL